MKNNNKQTTLWLLTYSVNAVIIYLAGILFPQNVAIGNTSVESWASILVTALLVTVVLMLVEPSLKALKIKVSNSAHIGIIYGIVNILALWILARGANWTGFGITSLWVAVILGLVLNLAQFVIWKDTMVKRK